MVFIKAVSGRRQNFDEMKMRDKLGTLHKTSEEDQASLFAKKLKIPYLDLNIYPIDMTALNILEREVAQKSHAVVLSQTGKKIKLAITDPEFEETKNTINNLQAEGFEVQLYLVSRTGLNRGLEKYKLFNLGEALDEMQVNLSGKDLEEFNEEIKELINLQKKIRDIPTTEILNIIISGAIKMEASDIHLEPQKEHIVLRYRLDGVLQSIVNIPYNVYPYVLSRVKMLSGLKLNIKDMAQDGRFEIKLNNPDKQIDVRVSLLPGNFGENIVMRLLSQDMGNIELEKLGLDGLPLKQLLNQIQKPNGMILNTGPTGSGKTTTLYACLKKANSPTVKIITIEDPIEYQLEGVTQTQVHKERGYDFVGGLRAIVRQDPDVILVGEIRDEETADIATHAALTGHLVFSTVHANSASGAIPRLIDLGIRPSLITPSVNAIIAQRLVRKLCPNCKEEYVPAAETLETINKLLSIISPKSNVEIPKNIKTLYRSKGCPKCHNLGYKGRIGIFEILEINQEIEKLILNLAPASQITAAAIENGMVTLTQDGILKAVRGETSMEEMQRVTGTGEFLKEIYENIMRKLLSLQLEISAEQVEKAEEIGFDNQKLQKMISESGNKDVLENIVAGGLKYDAGDIHLEPQGEMVSIRYRIDGILQDIASINQRDYLPILSKIKNLSGFKTSSHEAVRDSRFGISLGKNFSHIENNQLDVRVSIITSGYGETVVMRLLHKSAQSLDINKLGIRKQTLSRILKESEKPNGIILNTGPTGSGKTTTLYSLLSRLNKPEIKIITVEDPIEYRMKGIIQTQINTEEGYDFSSALRSLLRQNPDIMMIGEIRDEETAKIAVQASLTGHLVLSSLHTNNAAGAVQRLINMNIDPSDIASASNAFIAQRLVRKLCPYCKKAVRPKKETLLKIKNVLQGISPTAGIDINQVIKRIFVPVGCSKCKNTGYSGVLPLTEAVIMTEKMQDLVLRFSVTSAIEKLAVEEGMVTMAQDGILNVIEGITSLEEVVRVTEE